MADSEIQTIAGALTAIAGAAAALLGIPKYFEYRSARDKKALVRAAFESVVKSLASPVEVEQVAAAILLRRFFDPLSEVGMADAAFAKSVVDVMAAILRNQPTGTLQKILADGLQYAPSLRHTDLQKTNLQNAYLGTRRDGSGVDLSNSDFYRSDLSGGSLKGANARGAFFYQARLGDTVLKKADLRESNFFEADLQGANFDGALLTGANFKGAVHLSAELAAKLDSNGTYVGPSPFIASPDDVGPSVAVFLSKPGFVDFRRAELVRFVTERATERGIRVRLMERADYASDVGSLAELRRTIACCSGAIVLGFPDIAIADGSWRAGTAEEQSLNGAFFSTPWTQIEAGMAVMAGLPILLVSAAKIHGGMFDLPETEQFIYRADPADAQSFGRFDAWCNAVRDVVRRP
jgi:uncharacterized protein YjbI with pentapeptide repeats